MNESENLVPKRRFKEFTNTGTWGQRKSKEICTISTGKGNTQDKIDDGKYPFYVRSATIERSNDYLYDQEAVLTVGDGVGTGKVFHYVNGKYNLHQRVYRMFDFNNEVSAKYFYYYFSKKFYRRVMAMTAKTSVDSVRLEMIADMIIEFPSPKEQQKIVKLFESLDDAIALHQRKLDKTKSLKSAYLLEMFPAEGERKPKRRFAGFTDDWEQRKLMETNTSFTDGNYGESYPSGNDMSDSRNGVPFLRGSNLKNGKLDNSGANYITLEKHKELTSGHLVYDDIVIAVRGSLGALGYVDIDNVDWNINSQLAIIRTDKSELNGAFVIQFLSSNKGQKELLSRQTGTALKQLPIKQLQDVPVPKPELAEQNKISEFFRQLDDTIALHQHHLDNHKELKKALLQKMFPRNGEKLPEVRFGGFTEVWEKRKLNKVMSDFIVPMRDKPKEFSGEIPWTRIEDIEGKYLNDSLSGQYVSQAIIEKMNLKVIPKDSLIVSASATFGVVAIVTQDLITNQTFIGLVPEANFDLDFLYTLFQTPTVRTKMKFESAGSTIFYITRQTFENMQFLLPSYEEQQSIGSFFKNIDDTITLLQQKLNDYQRLKKVMLQQMFV